MTRGGVDEGRCKPQDTDDDGADGHPNVEPAIYWESTHHSQTISLFSYSEIVMIFENSFLQTRQRKLYWGMTSSPSKTQLTKILVARVAGVNQGDKLVSGVLESSSVCPTLQPKHAYSAGEVSRRSRVRNSSPCKGRWMAGALSKSTTSRKPFQLSRSPQVRKPRG